MLINYWECKFHDYDEAFDGEDEIRTYGCTHQDGEGLCPHDNKWCDELAECSLAEIGEE